MATMMLIRPRGPPPNENAVISPKFGTCEDSCGECESQFRIPHWQKNDESWSYNIPILSLKQAHKLTHGYAGSIAADLIYLQEKINNQGTTIINKWKKKSHQKRCDDLIRALPSMCNSPCFMVTSRNTLPDWKKARDFKTMFLLPYLNTEQLQKDPHRLLALLHARARYTPDKWVLFDKNQMSGGWREGKLGADYADCAVSLQCSSYGALVRWDTDSAHRWDICAFPRAKLILEAQYILMKFLRTMVEGLLEGVSTEGGPLKWIQLANSGFRGSVGSEAWSAFMNKAYTTPTFKFDKLIEIAKSKLAEASDHLWLLQTDAAYFLHTLKAYDQSQFIRNPTRQSVAYHNDHVFPMDTWADPAIRVQEWDWAVQELQHAKSVYDKFRGSMRPGQPIPPEVEFALNSLELFLVNHACQGGGWIKKLIPRMTAFRDLLDISPRLSDQLSVHLGYSVSSIAKECEAYYKKDPLFWCLYKLSEDFQLNCSTNPAGVFRYLDHWLASDSTTIASKSRLDSRLLIDLSSLAAVHEIHTALTEARPKNYFIPNVTGELVSKEAYGSWRCMLPDMGSRVNEYPQHLTAKLAKAYALLLPMTFPAGVRNAAWLEKADLIRGVSDQFWDTARELHRWWMEREEIQHSLRGAAEKEALLVHLSYHRSPEHRASIQAERDAIVAPKLPKAAPKQSSHDCALEWASRFANEKSSIPDRTHAKVKVKRRPEQPTLTEEIQQDFSTIILTSPPLTYSTANTHPPIRVKRETVVVFSRLFPATATEYAAKPLDWRSFVIAMEDAGFLATQSGGSAVAFVKEGEGRIVLHKPHTVPKIEQIWLQSWGKRMKKWFGWERETFVDVKEVVEGKGA